MTRRPSARRPVAHDPALERRLLEATRSATAALRRLPELLGALRDLEAGYPTSVGYEGDRTSGHTTVLDTWCDDHHQDIADCQAAGRPCAGTPIPAVSDPTGEAAVVRRDTARRHEREVRDLVARFERTADRLQRIGDLYLPDPLTEKALASLRSEAKDPCEIHRLAGARVDAIASTDLSNAKKAKRRLERKHVCRWCRGFGVTHGRWPTTTEALANARGQRVMVPADEAT